MENYTFDGFTMAPFAIFPSITREIYASIGRNFNELGKEETSFLLQAKAFRFQVLSYYIFISNSISQFPFFYSFET